MAWGEDNILKEKLEGLMDLPSDYAPNLDSKWSIVEAGLHAEQKKNVWLWYSSAAALLLVGSFWFFKPQTNQVAINHQPTQVKVEAQPKPLEVVTPSQPIAAKRTPKAKPLLAAKPEVSNQDSELVVTQVSLSQVDTFKAVAVAMPVVTKKRYIEIDFIDSANPPTPQTNMAAQQFRFRLGGERSWVNKSAQTTAPIKLSRTF